jgi:Ca2+-transporting ATPase
MAAITSAPPKAADSESTAWHVQTREQALAQLNATPAGISNSEAEARRARFGTNELVERKATTVWEILWEQLTNPLVLLLIGAAILSAFLGKADSVIAIMAIVIINAILGVVQEYRAEQAMAALKRMAAPLVRVRRDGQIQDVEARSLVPGDIILVEAGSIVPADARLIEAANLRVAEASLTGESQPVDKSIDALDDAKAPIGDRSNMLYMGTSVTYGRGEAVIAEIGMRTELGRIAEMIQSVEGEKTPLQRRMDELGVVLLRAALVVMAIAFLVGVVTGQPILPDPADPQSQSVLLNAVAIAVAVVPEGLPAVVTIALALGAQRMLRRRALIRKLPAVETLGSVTTICSDKTGTLTQNLMTVTILDVAGETLSLDDAVKNRDEGVDTTTQNVKDAHIARDLTLLSGSLCNDAVLTRGEKGEPTYIGDPTEGAIVIAAERFSMSKPRLEDMLPRVGEVPFDSDRKRMSTVHQLAAGSAAAQLPVLQHLGAKAGDLFVFAKGAADGLLRVSNRAFMHGEIVELTPVLRERIEAANNQFAQAGLRVLGAAYRPLDAMPSAVNEATIERDLIFVGMIGIIDPPRVEVKDAVRIAKTAGIRPVMITGDHPLTALAIAKELGIADDSSRVMTGHELAQMSQTELEGVVEQVPVYARVSPENKLNIVQALQTRGHVTAMTGDGVNDAPALKRSDIGVAMGITGTAVSKEASDMVILDDNFATIVSAVEEGRTIYENVRRFVKYLLASNTGELIVLLGTQLAGLSLPLTTLQILWMNLITDGIPALALGVEKAEPGGMQRPPYAPNESLFGRGLARHIAIVGSLLGITGVLLALWAYGTDQRAANGDVAWNTMVFIFLTIAQMGHALGLRSHRDSLFTMNPFGNRLLIGAVVVTLIAQFCAVYLPFFNNIFNTAPLTAEQLAICLVLSTIVFWGVELEKLLMRRGILK